MISIHQSQFLPWLPYYYKILKSDIFVIMDDVQYQKNGVQNRNVIKTPSGESYITVPVVTKSDTLINEAVILNKIHLNKILKTLRNNYSKSKYFDDIFPKIEELFNTKEYTMLNNLNIDLINLTLGLLDSNTEIKFSSEFNSKSKKDDLVLDLILANNENEYITGSGGLEYMDLSKFYDEGIKIFEYKFEYKEYTQLWHKKGFIKYLSIIDLLFNDLENAHEYIIKNGSLNIIER